MFGSALLVTLGFVAATSVFEDEKVSSQLTTAYDVISLKEEIMDRADKISFYLHTRSNPDSALEIFVGDLKNASYNPSHSTKFLIHGYNRDAFGQWQKAMKDAYLERNNYNIITVNWAQLATSPLYFTPRRNVKPTGQYVGKMVDYLVSLGGSTANFHLIGHSLGAHVSGFAGKVVTTGKLGRITGLDPALPLFSLNKPNERLSNSDATFVDIIHTCGGYLGFEDPIGHADFYPNSGSFQPGCDFDITCICSHDRAHEFFLESIANPEAFRSVSCDTWRSFEHQECTSAGPVMGDWSESSARGKFYLHTKAQPPFSLNSRDLRQPLVLKWNSTSAI